MLVYHIEYYVYLPKICIYFILHFDLRSDPDLDTHFFSSGSGLAFFSQLDLDPWKKMPDPHPWFNTFFLNSQTKIYYTLKKTLVRIRQAWVPFAR